MIAAIKAALLALPAIVTIAKQVAPYVGRLVDQADAWFAVRKRDQETEERKVAALEKLAAQKETGDTSRIEDTLNDLGR